MTNNAAKQKKEEEILSIFSKNREIKDKESIDYKKLLQKIYAPIWDWALMCFKEEDVCKASIEITHCGHCIGCVSYKPIFEMTIYTICGGFDKRLEAKSIK